MVQIRERGLQRKRRWALGMGVFVCYRLPGTAVREWRPRWALGSHSILCYRPRLSLRWRWKCTGGTPRSFQAWETLTSTGKRVSA